MNREMRRLQEREERRRKKEEAKAGKAQRKAAQMQSKASPTGEYKPFFVRVRDYLHEVRQELRKVTWPTREQMIAYTIVTVITSTVLTAVIFGLDVVAKESVIWLVERRGG